MINHPLFAAEFWNHFIQGTASGHMIQDHILCLQTGHFGNRLRCSCRKPVVNVFCINARLVAHIPQYFCNCKSIIADCIPHRNGWQQLNHPHCAASFVSVWCSCACRASTCFVNASICIRLFFCCNSRSATRSARAALLCACVSMIYNSISCNACAVLALK